MFSGIYQTRSWVAIETVLADRQEHGYDSVVSAALNAGGIEKDVELLIDQALCDDRLRFSLIRKTLWLHATDRQEVMPK